MRKLSSRDVGTADIRPRTVSGNDAVVNLVENPKSALDQLREIARQHMAAGKKMSFEQAFREIYQRPDNAALVAQEAADRWAGARYIDVPEL